MPSYKKGSCEITEKSDLNFDKGIFLISIPLINKFPSDISIILVNAREIDVLPAPVLPTIPIFYLS